MLNLSSELRNGMIFMIAEYEVKHMEEKKDDKQPLNRMVWIFGAWLFGGIGAMISPEFWGIIAFVLLLFVLFYTERADRKAGK